MTSSNKIRSYLDHIYELDYKERPVSMKEFLSDPKFLGSVTGGGKGVRPVWKTALTDISREDRKYIVILTGAIGTGKTTTAIVGIAYVMHRILCLKDPWTYFGKMGGGKMAIVFFNLTKTLSEGKGFNQLQSYLLASPWFRSHGIVSGSKEKGNEKIEFPIFDYKLASPYAQGFGFIGEHVIAAIMDEVDSQIASEPQKKRIMAAYEATIRRFVSRFVFDDQSIGRLFLVASKQERLSFLNTFIIKMQGSKNVYLVDIALWEASDQSEYCGEKFQISLGDQFFPPKIIRSEDDVKEAIGRNFKILNVPIEFKDDFELDIVGALRDIAGVSITQLRTTKLFAAESVLTEVYDRNRLNPVSVQTIEVGLKDDVDLLKFIDLPKIRVGRNVPRYIHVDIAFTGDALGLGMSCVSGWTKVDSLREDGTFALIKKPVVETDFAMRIKARHGDQIPIHKVHKLILDLKNICRFNIVLCTFDLRIASITSSQVIELAGIKCDSLSLDKSPQLHLGFRDLVNEGRWLCFYDPYLHFELVNLEYDPVRNKIDHPDEISEVVLLESGDTKEVVLSGTKDKSDGVIGSAMNALANCDVPPDIEVMKRLYDAVSSGEKTETDTVEKIIGIAPKPVNKPDTPKNGEAINIYMDILRKCTDDKYTK